MDARGHTRDTGILPVRTTLEFQAPRISNVLESQSHARPQSSTYVVTSGVKRPLNVIPAGAYPAAGRWMCT